MKAVTFVEVETPAFAGGSPESSQTWRFAEPTAGLPRDIDAIPSIASLSVTPSIISLGQNLGQRATITISFKDHRHIFNGEPFDQGTFWGKWRGRYGTKLRGKALRLIRGLVGQSLDEMEVWHYVIESTDGPTPAGVYTITATDVLKFADADRALAPRPSNGFIVANIDEDDTAATLSPSGIGDFEYPASGYVNIGGKEVCAFTRSGDSLTLTRAATIPGFSFETEVVAHQAGARAQLCLPIIAQDPADIIAMLFEDYAGMPGEYIPLAAWQAETGTFLQQLYTTLVCEPTGVNKLASELVEQAALAVWWSARQRLLRLQVLRAISTLAETFTDSNTMEGTLKTQEQPTTRLSEVLTYFALRNPLKPVDQPDNYRSALLTPDLTAEFEYGGVANKTLYSRWIPFGARAVASRLNTLKLGRFRDPPRRFTFEAYRYGPENLVEGGGYQLGWKANQDEQGNEVLAPLQITRLNPLADRFAIEAEEMLFTNIDPGDLTNRVIVIDSAINSINLRTLHDNLYPAPTGGESPPISVTFIIDPNVVVGANSTAVPAITVGDWPVGLVPLLRVRGRIQGAGGRGGQTGSLAGLTGGPALYTRAPIDLDLAGGKIWGGGGGGAVLEAQNGSVAAGGGGGAGTVPGAGGNNADGTANGSPGTPTAGGEGGVLAFLSGGRGGDPGEPGGLASFGSGIAGAAGAAIDGDSYINLTDPGEILGPQIN